MKTIQRQNYVEGIERDLMASLIMAVSNRKTTEDRVQSISRQYLTFADEPVMEIMMRKLRDLGKQFSEVRDMAFQYWAQYVEDTRQIALMRTHVYLKNGNIEKALITARGGTYYD